ncbi:serine/threonine-protein kinase pim-3-like [Triplophysa dalaica]|uniref:serine/threonine-protein kinase pim-3-like n=1 Tax=Triplophysa dalaica TaxID=1582913 RepID=UPI0024DF760C|nr:serine/threonine-protein kinase pim-3-like [Triplophysa dalaica]
MRRFWRIKSSIASEEINSCQYKIGKILGKGGFGKVHEGTRLSDGLKVAVKFVTKSDEDEYISIPGHPELLMQEVALQILISKGDKVPEIIQLLDWQEHADRYVMVLERFAPCKDLSMFLKEDELDEYLANIDMFQATRAALICCKRGVLHRDIKLQNLLISTDYTFEVKLIDFGCGDLLKESAYDSYMGTEDYTCPEFYETGEYHGKPATVYSLGVLLLVMICRRIPSSKDFDRINQKIWCKDGFSEECCSLVQACLQEYPKEPIQLRQIIKHKWFQLRETIAAHIAFAEGFGVVQQSGPWFHTSGLG